MRVLIVNKFYYPRGGDCLVAMSVEKLLKEHGHEVAFFAMQYSENIYSEWQNYFPTEISFSGGGLSGKILALKRLLGKDDVAQKFSSLVENFRPDVVHLHNVHSYLSPVVAEIAKKKGIKVVWTLHDYKLVCPSYSFLRNGQVCELCLERPISVLTNKCMKGSFPASLLAYTEASVWSKERLLKNVDAFICPSKFMADKMYQGGFPSNKLKVLPNFVSFDNLDTPLAMDKREKSYCYVGRLSEEKGVGFLLQAATQLPYKLYVAGSGPMLPELRKKFEQENIVFLGQQTPEQVRKLFQKSCFSVIPSIWYENNPLSVIESLCLGTPVLGAAIGGIPELIKEGTNGLLFQPGRVDDLKEKIASFFRKIENGDFQPAEIVSDAIANFSEATYYEKLIAEFS